MPARSSSSRVALSERGELLDSWAASMRRRGVTDGSIYSFVNITRQWFDFTGNQPWRTSWRDVERFVDSTGRRTARSRYSVVTTLHVFYKWAQREGLTKRDPTVLVERPRIPTGLPRPIDDTGLMLALTLADPPMRAALLLGCTGGLRAVEMSRLQWRDVSSTSLRVCGKAGKERVIPLHADCRVALDGLDRLDEWVLPWFRSKVAHLEARSAGYRVSQAVNRYLAGIGVDASCHMLRHWFATRALAVSGDLKAVQDLLGHASPATTAIYAALDPTRLIPVVAAIEVPGLPGRATHPIQPTLFDDLADAQ